MSKTPEKLSVNSFLVQVNKTGLQGIDLPGFSIPELLRGLAHQSPNRVYFNPKDGNVTLGVLFDERTGLFGAYLQRVALPNGMWQPLDEIELTSPSLNERERKILQWKEGFGMVGNLVLNPIAVFRIVESPYPPSYEEFVHMAETEQGMLHYHYEWNPNMQTPRVLSIGFGMEDLQKYSLEQIQTPPAPIIEYSKG